jgi:hypothetical protein
MHIDASRRLPLYGKDMPSRCQRRRTGYGPNVSREELAEVHRRHHGRNSEVLSHDHADDEMP